MVFGGNYARIDMKYCNKFYKMRDGKALKGVERAGYKADIEAREQEGEKVILFYQKHGYKLTQEAFGVKRYTLLDRQRKYKEFAITGLINGDRTRKRKRQSVISQEIKDFIKEYRQEHGNIPQDEIKPHLDKYCKGKKIKSTLQV